MEILTRKERNELLQLSRSDIFRDQMRYLKENNIYDFSDYLKILCSLHSLWGHPMKDCKPIHGNNFLM